MNISASAEVIVLKYPMLLRPRILMCPDPSEVNVPVTETYVPYHTAIGNNHTHLTVKEVWELIRLFSSEIVRLDDGKIKV